MIAGSLEIQMLANLARLQQDMNQAKTMVGSAMQTIETAVGGAMRAFAALGGVLSVGMFTAMVRGTIDAADHLNDLNKSTDISIESLSGLRLLARQTGSDLDSMATAINKLSVNMGKDAEKFKALGITAKDPLEAFKQLSDIFVAIKDPQLRAAVAAEALGKAWAGTAPALSEGGKRIGEIVQRGADLSGVTTKMARQADELNDKWAELGGTGGFLNRMIGPLLPILIELTNDMLDAQKKTDGLKESFSPLAEIMRTLIVLGGNFAYVWRTIGVSIAGVGEQMRGFKDGGIKGFKEARETMKGILDQERKDFDAWEARMMGAGKGPDGGDSSTPASAAAAAAAAARAKGFLDDGKAAKEALAMREKYRKMDADSWVKHIEETTAEYERGLAEEAKLTEEFYKRKAILDAADQKAMFDIIDAEQDFAIEVGRAMTQEMTENHKQLEETAKLAKAEAERAAEDAKRAQIDMWRDVDRVAHDTFVSIFDAGKSTFDRLKDTLKNGLYSLLYNMTLKPFLIQIVGSAAGSSVAQAAFPGGNGLGNLSAFSNLLPGGGIGGALFGSAGAYAAAVPGLTSAAAGSQAALLASQTSVFGAAGLGATAASGGAAGIGAGLSALGTALPYIGAALAAAQLLGVFGSKKKPASFSGGRLTGTASMSGFSGDLFGTSTSDPNNPLMNQWLNNDSGEIVAQLTKPVQDAFAQMKTMAEALKLDTSKLADVSATFDLTGVGQIGSEVLPAFEQGLGTLTDSIALKLMPNIAELAQQNETLTQTFARLALETEATAAAEKQRISELASQRRTLDIQVLELQGRAEEALAAKRADELAALDPTLRSTQALINALEDQASAQDILKQSYQAQAATLQDTIGKWATAAKTLRDYGASLIGIGAGGMSYATAASRFAITAAQARSGSADAMGGLQTAGEAFRTASMARSGTVTDYLRDVGQIRSAVSDAANVADRQGSLAQQQLDAMTTAASRLGVIEEKMVSVETAMSDLKASSRTTADMLQRVTRDGNALVTVPA